MEFVSFEFAKQLKEKGFPQHWSDMAYIADHEEEEEGYEVGGKYPIEFIPDYLPTIAAPTISQVLEWLRREKNIYVSIFIDDDSDCPVTYEIYKGTECMRTHHGEYFALKDWNKCELCAIEYVLDNLI